MFKNILVLGFCFISLLTLAACGSSQSDLQGIFNDRARNAGARAGY